MYLHLEDHCYLAFYDEAALILDLKKNSFACLGKGFNEFLKEYLIKLTPFSSEEISCQEKKLKEILCKRKIINPILKAVPNQKRIDSKRTLDSLKRVSWKIPTYDLIKRPRISKFLLSFFLIVFVRVLIKSKTFHAVIRKIDRKKTDMIHNSVLLRELAKNISYASFFVPFQIKCLEWALTVVMLAHIYKIKCYFIIGVQTHPFVSHAWIEDHNGEVIFDDPGLKGSLARILVI